MPKSIMQCMDFFKDEDVKRYLFFGTIGLVVFLITAGFCLCFFKQNYEISLLSYTVDFGENISIVELVDTVGDDKITSNNIVNSNTIKVDDIEIYFDNFDTNILGKQTVRASFSKEGIDEQIFDITVVDKVAPIISIDTETPLELSIDDVKTKSIGNVYHVTDNQTPDNKIDIRTYIEENDFNQGDLVHLFIEASDISQNTATAIIEIMIKKDKTDMKIKTAAKESEEPSDVDSSMKDDGYSGTNPSYSSNSNYSAPSTNDNQSYVIPACSYKSFYESSYGDLISAYNAALAYYDTCDTASLNPINDSEGNTIGWSVG